MLQIPEKILVIAKSARMLTEYLTKVGYGVIAVDCYGDIDTRQMALVHQHVPSLALDHIKQPLMLLKSRHGLKSVIYGSGFEKNLDSLHFLQTELRLLGNSAVCFSAVQDKPCFFRRLDQLGIAYPPVSLTPPDEDRQWLVKPVVGEGGVGVCRYAANSPPPGEPVYWQRFIDGVPMSVLFIAANGQVDMVGYQQQLIGCGNSVQPFLFTGVVSCLDVAAVVQEVLAAWVVKLVNHFQLRGLNSLDFILKDERCYVLEVNARPPASMQLYGTDIIQAHIRAIESGALGLSLTTDGYNGYKIIYADTEIVVEPRGDWPEWVVDRPIPDSIIGQGEPICSIIARAKTRQLLLDCLQQKQQVIENFLKTGI